MGTGQEKNPYLLHASDCFPALEEGADYENLYIHVPFCLKKCAYCAFYSSVQNDQEHWDAYLTRLCLDLKHYSPKLQRVKTLYFGGGTPTCPDAAFLARMLERIRESVRFVPGAEISMESNPETVTREKAQLLAGTVNRISMGVQSFSPEMLKRIGRGTAAPETVARAVDAYRNAGINALNFDLIYGIPGQTLPEFESDLRRALAFAPQHLSAYSLTVEEGTRLAESLSASAAGDTDETESDLSCEMWELAGAVLAENGMPRYEISNYAALAFEAKHNQNIWHGERYLGLGPSGSSFDGIDRFTNVPSLDGWCAGAVPLKDAIPAAERIHELFIMGLRTLRGWRKNEFLQACRRIGADNDTCWTELATRALPLQADGLLELRPNEIRPTEQGLRFWNDLACELL